MLSQRKPRPPTVPAPTFAAIADHVFLPADKVVFVKHGDRTVLLDYARGEYYGLDEVGTRMWELLADRLSVSEMVDRLEQEFDVARNALESDAATFLTHLVDLHLVVR